MIITIAGKPGSGKSTIGKMLAGKYGLKHYSGGEMQRAIAKEKGITIMQLSIIEEKDKTLDNKIDKKIAEMGKKENDFVIDSRLAFHFIPNAIKVFLDADEETGADRIFKAMRKDEKENTSYEATFENLMRRERSEKDRFRRYYNIDIYNLKNYDIVIDTTDLSIDEVFRKLCREIEKLKKAKKKS